MTVVGLITMLAVQQPQVTARVDRTAVAAGDTIVFTIRVEAGGGEAVRIEDPSHAGLLLAGARENSAVEIAGEERRRVTTRELRLVAVQPGSWGIGAARVIQGASVVTTTPLTIVVSGDPASAPLSAESLRRLIDAAPPPATQNEVAVTLAVEPTTVTLGQQVDLLALAWFPREIRTRMRTPATFENPRAGGVWSYRHALPAGVIATRRVGGTTYDLFAQHETLFPLREGPLVLGPAILSYSFPLTFSFLSREVRHELQSDSVLIQVRPLPATGRPSGFRGVAASGLTVELAPVTFDLYTGDARPFTVTISGRGNVALWPEPEFRWPAGLRVYPGDVEVAVERSGVDLEGSKTFHYLLVADSAGSYRVPPVDYPYFDWRAGRYVALRSVALDVSARLRPGRSLPAIAGPAPLERAPFVLPLTFSSLPWWVWGVIALLPPLLALAPRVSWPRPRPRSPKAPPVATEARPLIELERAFAGRLERLVPDARHLGDAALIAALRAAGIEAPRAAHVARLRDRLRQAVYGGGQVTDAAELLAEAREVLAGPLAARTSEARLPSLRDIVVGLALATVIPWGIGRAQSVTAEQLLAAGAHAAAADSFAARALREPRNPGHWYHLGVAWFSLGSQERARAAWIRAARLAPRSAAIRRA
ncbi:MAG TPA: BatD family protein, partial [bacterium]|nr:BatD family protein [bacterium]